MDLARSCSFIEGRKKANLSVVASACRGAFQVHPLWMERDTHCVPVAPLGCAVLKAVVAHNLACRGSLQGRLDRQRGRTTSKPEGGCHGPDPGAGIRQCRRNARTIRDVSGLHLFLGNENWQRSQLKSCHPIWQRQRKTISDIYEYADWADTCRLGWERGGRILPSGAEV